MIYARWWQHQVTFPQSEEPEWKDRVERWYQLDSAAFALTATYWKFRRDLPEIPDWIFLASPRGSNATDRQFAATPPSPAKFVHTLPNIRAACMLQVMGQTSRVLCLQNDPQTALTGLSEALHLVATDGQPVWVLCVQEGQELSQALIFALSPDPQHATLKLRIIDEGSRASDASHDKHFFLWLNQSEQTDRNFIADRFEIIKCRAL